MRGVTPREELKLTKNFTDYGYEFFRMRTVKANSRAAHTHLHDAVECIYMIEGSVIIYIDGDEEVLYPGDFAVFRSRGVHSIYTKDEPQNSYYVLKLSPSFLHKITPAPLNGSFPFRFAVFNPELKYIWRKAELEGSIIKECLDELIEGIDSESSISDVSRIILAFRILEAVYKETESSFNTLTLYSDTVYRAIVYINEHFAEDITEEEVASKFGMSYAYFSRSFKGATGKNFRNYLAATRLSQAEQLIVNTNMPVAEIAGRCGYSNVSHFIKIYKDTKGKTPLQARKAH